MIAGTMSPDQQAHGSTHRAASSDPEPIARETNLLTIAATALPTTPVGTRLAFRRWASHVVMYDITADDTLEFEVGDLDVQGLGSRQWRLLQHGAMLFELEADLPDDTSRASVRGSTPWLRKAKAKARRACVSASPTSPRS